MKPTPAPRPARRALAPPARPDWTHRSTDDLLRRLYVCPAPGPALDELMRR